MARGALSSALAVALLHAASALDNGVRLPPMGWYVKAVPRFLMRAAAASCRHRMHSMLPLPLRPRFLAALRVRRGGHTPAHVHVRRRPHHRTE